MEDELCWWLFAVLPLDTDVFKATNYCSWSMCKYDPGWNAIIFSLAAAGLCFLILSVLQSLGNSDTVAFKIFSQMVTEFILDFFQQDYDVFIANMPKQTFFLSVFMAFAHLQKHNPVFDFLGIGNVCFSSHYLKSLCKYLYPSTQNSIGLIFLSTKQFFTCHWNSATVMFSWVSFIFP